MGRNYLQLNCQRPKTGSISFDGNTYDFQWLDYWMHSDTNAYQRTEEGYYSATNLNNTTSSAVVLIIEGILPKIYNAPVYWVDGLVYGHTRVLLKNNNAGSTKVYLDSISIDIGAVNGSGSDIATIDQTGFETATGTGNTFEAVAPFWVDTDNPIKITEDDRLKIKIKYWAHLSVTDTEPELYAYHDVDSTAEDTTVNVPIVLK